MTGEERSCHRCRAPLAPGESRRDIGGALCDACAASRINPLRYARLVALPPGEAEAEQDATAAPFRWRGAPWNKESRAGAALELAGAAQLLLGLGVFFALLGLVTSLLDRSWRPYALGGLAIGGALLALGVVTRLFGGKRAARCPWCESETTVPRRAGHALCDACGTVLHLGPSPREQVVLIDCGYCGHRTATTRDHPRLLCPDCGGLRASRATSKCPACRGEIPATALYCARCGWLQRRDSERCPAGASGGPGIPYGYFWRIGASPRGAVWRAVGTLLRLAEQPPQRIEARALAARKRELAGALESLDQAFHHPLGRREAPKGLVAAELAYAGLLATQVLCLIEPERPSGASTPGALPGQLGAIASADARRVAGDEPYIAPRRRVEARFGAELERWGGAGVWREKLAESLVFTRRQTGVEMRNGAPIRRIHSDFLTDLGFFFEELRRLQAWCQKRGMPIVDDALFRKVLLYHTVSGKKMKRPQQDPLAPST